MFELGRYPKHESNKSSYFNDQLFLWPVVIAYSWVTWKFNIMVLSEDDNSLKVDIAFFPYEKNSINVIPRRETEDAV